MAENLTFEERRQPTATVAPPAAEGSIVRRRTFSWPRLLNGVVLASWRLVMRTFGRPGFYLLFAVSVTASVQLVGVYLVFASLMVPALATRSLAKYALVAGYAIGFLGYLVGLLLSAVYDAPTGAVIVWTLTLVGLAAAPLLARWRGAATLEG